MRRVSWESLHGAKGAPTTLPRRETNANQTLVTAQQKLNHSIPTKKRSRSRPRNSLISRSGAVSHNLSPSPSGHTARHEYFRPLCSGEWGSSKQRLLHVSSNESRGPALERVLPRRLAMHQPTPKGPRRNAARRDAAGDPAIAHTTLLLSLSGEHRGEVHAHYKTRGEPMTAASVNGEKVLTLSGIVLRSPCCPSNTM